MKTISSLKPSDFQSALAIEKASHAFPWSEKTLLSNQGERYLNIKVDVDDVMVGFAIVQVVLDEATLFNIAISPDYQSQGLGKSLLAHVIELLRQREVMVLWLEVRQSNSRAISLYRSMGFNEVTVRKNYYPTASGKEDALIMALYL